MFFIPPHLKCGLKLLNLHIESVTNPKIGNNVQRLIVGQLVEFHPARDKKPHHNQRHRLAGGGHPSEILRYTYRSPRPAPIRKLALQPCAALHLYVHARPTFARTYTLQYVLALDVRPHT